MDYKKLADAVSQKKVGFLNVILKDRDKWRNTKTIHCLKSLMTFSLYLKRKEKKLFPNLFYQNLVDSDWTVWDPDASLFYNSTSGCHTKLRKALPE